MGVRAAKASAFLSGNAEFSVKNRLLRDACFSSKCLSTITVRKAKKKVPAKNKGTSRTDSTVNILLVGTSGAFSLLSESDLRTSGDLLGASGAFFGNN